MTSDNTRREKFGYAPLNEPFKNSDFHHLHYRPKAGGVDRAIGIHIPKDLHNSIRHNPFTGQGMHEINLSALQWYIIYTTDNINPVAIGLYQHYKNMTRLEIQTEQDKLWKAENGTRPPLIDFSYMLHYGIFNKELEIEARKNQPAYFSVEYFVNKYCEIGQRKYEMLETLYDLYTHAANRKGYRPINKKQFVLGMQELGFYKEKGTLKGNPIIYFEGLKLKTV